MSELKAFNCVDSDLQEFCEPRLVYLKSEADKVIAEKDAKILALDAEVFKQRYHAKLFFDERNYAESQLRATKRALWMARKAHAVAMVAYWDSHYRDNPNAVYRNRTIDWLRNRWLLILDCCIKKEKEYK